MDLLPVTVDERAQILKLYDVNDVRLKEDIEIIKTWKSKQPHLQGDLSDDFLEKLLIKNKFSVERCKEKLENYYTLRGTNKDLLEGFEKIIPSKEALIFLPLHKLTPNYERVVIMKLIIVDPKVYDILSGFKFALAVNEMMLRHDCSLGVRFIMDYTGFTLKHLAKWNPILMLRCYNLAEKAYSLRILGMEFINYPTFINKVFAMLKMFLRPKIYDRIRLHENLESLYKVIPKECLPADYGGTNSKMCDLLEKWDKEVEKQQKFLLHCANTVANEDLRPPESQENDLFGTGGTFKKLSLD
ncbi:alpha-tocopherol transfer protein-like isoform X3 [Tribolium madens]|uniref:alpha-tocopherol transfer protein-like isoform X3 n=1 Tax=Tribolium madens TaxID=41895 RepID=UPI001CF7551B|nr:alpha-tocopherol transfer protein-like isoform X3 [Tribolium madens]XP_044262710.1 alpha-tocopherol transfer protein-like isoform X3 [Tribolium madens]XP_044262711.1 alpha-tocopherol transfer protein-like isoform X3 [Tribolium madens]